MSHYSTLEIWLIIAVVGAGTFFMRYSFLGALGNRPMPDWLLRMLRYTPVAVIPGLMAPQIFLPAAGETAPDPVRLTAAAITVAVGLWTRNAIWAMIAGAAVMVGLTLLT